jgi:hypothetical protein
MINLSKNWVRVIFLKNGLNKLFMQIKVCNLIAIENKELRLSQFSKLGKSLF